MTLASNAKRSTGARKFLLHSGIMPEEQAEATRFLVNNPRSALWMMPGLGKTLATLAAIRSQEPGKSHQGPGRQSQVRCQGPIPVLCLALWPADLLPRADGDPEGNTLGRVQADTNLPVNQPLLEEVGARNDVWRPAV